MYTIIYLFMGQKTQNLNLLLKVTTLYVNLKKKKKKKSYEVMTHMN